MKNKPSLALTSLFILGTASAAYGMENDDDIVEKILKNISNEVHYKEDNWNSHTKDEVSFTIPYRPVKTFFENTKTDNKEENSNLVLHAEEIIEIDNSEAVESNEILIIEGNDRRKTIRDTKKWPYCINAKLRIKFPFSTNSFGGSGVLIGPHHILTAGHNVYSNKKFHNKRQIKEEERWATNISVNLGLHMDETPFGTQETVKIYTFKQWTERKPGHDMALLILNESVGYETGWAGLACLPDSILQEKKAIIAGYPGDGKNEEKFKVMRKMSGNINEYEQEKLIYEIDTSGGQSGSGIWIKKRDMPYVIGVHVSGDKENRINIGTRLSKNKYKQLIALISKNYKILGSEESLEKNNTDSKKRKSIENNNFIKEIIQTNNNKTNKKSHIENDLNANNENNPTFKEKSNQFVTDKLELATPCDELIEELIPSKIYDIKDNGVWKVIRESITINKDKKIFDLKINGIKNKNSTNAHDKVLCEILKEYENLFVFPNNKTLVSKTNLEKIIKQIENNNNKNERNTLMKKTAESFLNLL